jgi:hypothetical protein
MPRPFTTHGAVLALGVMLCPAVAGAITSTQAPIHETENHEEPKLTISRDDCLGQTEITFALGGMQGSDALSIWVSTTGADCKVDTARNGADAACFLVRDIGTVGETALSLVVGSHEIANAIENVENCTDATSSDKARPIKLFFLIDVQLGTVAAENALEFADLSVDLLGPPPPTALDARLHDDGQLAITFTPPEGVEDMNGVRAYCSAAIVPGGASTVTTTTGVGGFGGTMGLGGPVGGGGMGGAGGSGADGGSAGASSVSASSAASASASATTAGAGGGATSECTPSDDRLTPGVAPDDMTACGSVEGAASEIVVNASNGVLTAVALVSLDTVNNSGVLSSVVCETANPVDDFFEIYRRSGGAAGGGFCNCGLVGERRDGALALLCFAAAGLGWSMRRRRRS